MSAEYTPETYIVKANYVYSNRMQRDTSLFQDDKYEEEFDRWRAEDTRNTKEETWDEGYVAGFLVALGSPSKDNPYRADAEEEE